MWLTYDSSNNAMHCDICRKTGPDIVGKTKFVTGKIKFKCESLVYQNKSMKHKKCLLNMDLRAGKKINSRQCDQNFQWATYFTCSYRSAGDLQNLFGRLFEMSKS